MKITKQETKGLLVYIAVITAVSSIGGKIGGIVGNRIADLIIKK